MTELKAAVEAIIFSIGDPVELETIAGALEMSEEDIKPVIEELMRDYESDERGMKLIALENSYQFVTKKEYYEPLIRIASNPKKPVLTESLMETLSIIAYRQPVTRGEIERIRGVSSDHAVGKLMEYGLIEELARLDAPGRPILFGTTEEFLRRFGMDSKESLPPIDPVAEEDFKAEAESEIPVTI